MTVLCVRILYMYCTWEVMYMYTYTCPCALNGPFETVYKFWLYVCCFYLSHSYLAYHGIAIWMQCTYMYTYMYSIYNLVGGSEELVNHQGSSSQSLYM